MRSTARHVSQKRPVRLPQSTHGLYSTSTGPVASTSSVEPVELSCRSFDAMAARWSADCWLGPDADRRPDALEVLVVVTITKVVVVVVVVEVVVVPVLVAAAVAAAVAVEVVVVVVVVVLHW